MQTNQEQHNKEEQVVVRATWRHESDASSSSSSIRIDRFGEGRSTVSIVVITVGESPQLSRCLDALASQTRRPGEIVLVTADTDQIHRVVNKWSGTRVVPTVGVFSFCRVANLGIAASHGEWVLLLNDDVVLRSTFVQRLIEGIPRDDLRIGMVCGKLLASDGRTIDSTGQFLRRDRTASERGFGAPDAGQFDEPGYVFAAPGAAALYRRTMLEALTSPPMRVVEDRAIRPQFFDERLGMYLEDLDLGWRAQRAGWRAYYVPGACATHARGATAKRRQPRWSWLRRYYFPQLPAKLQARYVLNRYRLMEKHGSFLSLLANAPWILWYEMRLWGYLVFFEPRTVSLLFRTIRRSRR